jgi:hypothetical protein
VISDQVPSVAIAADAGTLSFVDRSRQIEHRSVWTTGLRASLRLPYTDVELGGFLAGGEDRALHASGGVFAGVRVGEFVGPVRPVFGFHAGFASLTERALGATKTTAFLTFSPSFGVDFPLSRRITVGSAIAYTYGIDLEKNGIGPQKGGELTQFDRTWITLSANVRYRF